MSRAQGAWSESVSVQVGVGSGQDGDINMYIQFKLFAYTHVHWLWSPTTDGSSCLIALSECESVLSLLLGEFSSAVWSWYLHWLTGVNTPTQDDIQVVAKYQGTSSDVPPVDSFVYLQNPPRNEPGR